MNILVLNAGSSTLKCAIFHLDGLSVDLQEPLWKGSLDWGKGRESATFVASSRNGGQERLSFPLVNIPSAAEKLLATAWSGDTAVIASPKNICVVGHRVVHGGQQFTEPTRVTAKVKASIAELSALAPLHNPANLEGIEIAEKIFPKVPQVAVFDTAYHATISEAAATYPVPLAWKDEGIRRYGFHGISHQYCAERAAQLGGGSGKIITCHLGNGCSLAATHGGRCVDTTMGFTPMEGMMMGSRSGSIDPGILLHRLRGKKCTGEELDHILNYESGLRGICGSSDMRDVLERMQGGDTSAALAFSMFIHRLKGYIAMMAASMDGLDVLVFTAGIGENSPEVRAEVSHGLKHLGVELDSQANTQGSLECRISAEYSRVKVYVIPTREDWMIAKAACSFGGSFFSRAWSLLRAC